MKKEIDWEKELLANGGFNFKFQKNLLEYGVKDLMLGIYIKYMNS